MPPVAADSIKQPAQSETSSLHNDFRSLVEGGWHIVHPNVRTRMDQLLTSPSATIFEGTGCVRHSAIGYLFAQLSRILGEPLVYGQGETVTTTVSVAPTKNGLRCWHREFRFSDGSSQLVQTSKLVTPGQGLMDAVGAQGEKMLRTKMRIWAEGRSLCFESTRYFLHILNFNIPIPSFLTPGTLFAEHRDMEDGTFRYIMKFDHPIWGQTFYQDGIFKMVETLHSQS